MPVGEATDIVVKLNPTGSNAIEASDISQAFVKQLMVVRHGQKFR